jgi:ABC-2 type transport system permease protein
MNNLMQTLRVELLKTRRSKMPLVTALGFALLPLAGGFFMFIIRDPELARSAGLISAKAQIAMGAADWQTYLGFLAQGIAVGGFLIFGLVGSWIFGREYADRTMKDLLALPTARSSIVLSKFAIMALWAGALTLWVCAIAMLVGALMGLPQFSAQAIAQALVRILFACVLTLALITPIVFFANAGRGYLPAIGVMFVAVFFAQVLTIAGWGEFFPWAIPALFAQGKEVGLFSFVIVILTGALGMAATFFWWEFADQNK